MRKLLYVVLAVLALAGTGACQYFGGGDANRVGPNPRGGAAAP